MFLQKVHLCTYLSYYTRHMALSSWKSHPAAVYVTARVSPHQGSLLCPCNHHLATNLSCRKHHTFQQTNSSVHNVCTISIWMSFGHSIVFISMSWRVVQMNVWVLFHINKHSHKSLTHNTIPCVYPVRKCLAQTLCREGVEQAILTTKWCNISHVSTAMRANFMTWDGVCRSLKKY